MSATSSTLARYAPLMLSVLRIVTALLFMEHGLAKLTGFPANTMMPPAGSLFWFAGLLEVLGGILLVLGLFTRPVAFLLSGEMAVAYFMVHIEKSFFPLVNGGDAAVLFCFVFFYIFLAGAGPIALDAKRGARAPL
ncbi:DoxX family protein [Thioclava sp. BHET1]|nr:DoxX family protein [Thioclava sp. BHET1]